MPTFRERLLEIQATAGNQRYTLVPNGQEEAVANQKNSYAIDDLTYENLKELACHLHDNWNINRINLKLYKNFYSPETWQGVMDGTIGKHQAHFYLTSYMEIITKTAETKDILTYLELTRHYFNRNLQTGLLEELRLSNNSVMGVFIRTLKNKFIIPIINLCTAIIQTTASILAIPFAIIILPLTRLFGYLYSYIRKSEWSNKTISYLISPLLGPLFNEQEPPVIYTVQEMELTDPSFTAAKVIATIGLNITFAIGIALGALLSVAVLPFALVPVAIYSKIFPLLHQNEITRREGNLTFSKAKIDDLINRLFLSLNHTKFFSRFSQERLQTIYSNILQSELAKIKGGEIDMMETIHSLMISMHPLRIKLEEVESAEARKAIESNVQHEIYHEFKNLVIERMKVDSISSINTFLQLLMRLHPNSIHNAETDTISINNEDFISELLEQIAVVRPANCEAAYQAGLLYFERDMFDHAHDCFLRVDESSVHYPDAIFQCGHYHYIRAYDSDTGVYDQNRLLLAKNYLSDSRLFTNGSAHRLLMYIDILLANGNEKNNATSKVVNSPTLKHLSFYNKNFDKYLTEFRDDLRKERLDCIEKEETVSEFARLKNNG